MTNSKALTISEGFLDSEAKVSMIKMSQQTNFKTEQTDFNKSLNTMVIETDNLKMELFSCTNDVCEKTDHYYLIVTDTLTDNLQDRRCFPIYDRLELSEAFAIMEGLLGGSLITGKLNGNFTKILRFDINNHLSHVNSKEAKEACGACDTQLMELFFYMVESDTDTLFDIQIAFYTIMYIANNHEYIHFTTNEEYEKCPIERFFTRAFSHNGFKGDDWNEFPSEYVNEFLDSDYSNAMCEIYDETRRRKEWTNKCTEHDTTFRFYLNSRSSMIKYKPLQIVKKFWTDPDPDDIMYEIYIDTHRTKGRDGFLEIYCNDCENVEGAMWLEFMY